VNRHARDVRVNGGEQAGDLEVGPPPQNMQGPGAVLAAGPGDQDALAQG